MNTFGEPSTTHPGDENFTTKKGNKVYHRKGKYISKSMRPYTRRRKTQQM